MISMSARLLRKHSLLTLLTRVNIAGYYRTNKELPSQTANKLWTIDFDFNT